MKLGDIANDGAAGNGKPLDGVRVLALDQGQLLRCALDHAQQLAARDVRAKKPGNALLDHHALADFHQFHEVAQVQDRAGT